MTPAHNAGVIVDTMVISWLLDDHSRPEAAAYRELIGSAPVLIAFQTVMELRYGALHAGWGDLRRRRLDSQLGEFAVVQPDDAMIAACAHVRAECRRQGHGLAAKGHVGDLWIAATAIRLGLPLVSHDQIFAGVPGLVVRTCDPPG